MKNIPKNIWIEISTKNLWRYIKNYPTTSEENYLPNNPLRETLYQTNFEKKSLPNKFPQQKPSRDISLPKNLKKHLNKQKHLKRLSLQKTLKRTISQKNPWREISTILCREIPTKQILEETSTKEEQCLQKDPGTNLYEKISEEKSLTKIQRNISTKK